MKRILLVLSLVVHASQAKGQDWAQVPSPFTSGNLAPYFLNQKIGFAYNASAYANGSSPTPNLALTNDGGITWSYIKYFDTVGSWSAGTQAGTTITQMCFVSLEHGYAATQSFGYGSTIYGDSGVFETTDQGTNWKKISTNGMNYLGVYATNNVVFAEEGSEGLAGC